MELLGKRMRLARRGQHMTQAELALLAHVSRRTVARWEKGEGVPSAIALAALAAFLKVSAAYLLGLRETPERPDYLKADEQALLADYRKMKQPLRAA